MVQQSTPTTRSGKKQMLVQYLLLAFFLFLLFPPIFYSLPEPGLDNSWSIALFLAHKYHLTFGKDFLFTYGPLGVLLHRLPISISKYVYLGFDLYFLITMGYIVRSLFKRYFGFAVAAFVFLYIMTNQYGVIHQWYYFFFFYFLFSFIEDPRRLGHLAQAAILSALVLYVKVSVGMTALFVFLIVINWLLIRGKLKWRPYLATLLIYFFLIWLGDLILNVDLKGYILGSLQLIDGYNDAMFRPVEPEFRIYLLTATIIVLSFAIWVLYLLIDSLRKKELIQHADQLMIQILIGPGIFVLFKSAFVRSDTHAYLFFANIVPLIGLSYLHLWPDLKKTSVAIYCWIVLVATAWAVNTMPGTFQPYMQVLNGRFLSLKAGEMGRYFWQLRDYDRVRAASDSLELRDNEYKAIIGHHSVDVFPTEISTVYFQGLRYNPRPMIQSYSAYTEYLDSLNCRKYRSAGGPDYILFSVGAIDGREPFFDESRTKLAMLGHYSVEGEIKNDLLLKKRPDPVELQPLLTDTSFAALGEDIAIRKTKNILFSRIYTSYTTWGSLKRLLYQPPLLKIRLTLDNGEVRTFRAIKPVLEDGVILNKFLESEDEFQLLQQSDGRLNTNVVSIRFECEDRDGGFARKIKMVNTYYAFPGKTEAQLRADSLGIARLYDRYNSFKPALVDTAHCLTDSILFGVGSVTGNSHLIRISDGWAFRVKGKNDNTVVRALLGLAGKAYEIPTETQARPDLLFAFGRADVGNSGFNAKVGKSQLPPGDYQLGVMLIDTVLHRRWIRFSENRVSIIRDPQITKLTSADAQPATGDQLTVGMNPLKEDDYKAYVGGWAFLPHEDTMGAVTNLILRSKNVDYRVTTNVKARPDVAASFKDPRLESCGFYVEVPKDQLPEGVYVIYVERQYAGNKGRHLVASGEEMKVGGTDLFIPAPLKELPPAGEIAMGIDFVKNEGDTLILSGWALKKPGEADSSQIDIILKGEKGSWSAATQTKYRPDVTRLFKGKFNYDFSGFYAKIPVKALPAGTWQPGIRLYQKGTKGIVKFIGQSVVLP